MHVMIVGAGIGGLVAALVLHEAGISCAIYEQSDRIRELGVGINILPPGVEVLAELGLLDRLQEVAISTTELRYAHRLGHEIMQRPCGRAAGHDVPQLSIHRGTLQGVLYQAVSERLGHDAVRTGHRLTNLAQSPNGVAAAFADRTGRALGERTGDILVGADGIHSTVRTTLFPGEGSPRWNGVLMWRGATEWPAFLDGNTVVIAGGNAAKLVLYPIAPGSTPDTRLTNWAVCVTTGAPGDDAPVRADWARPGDRAELAAQLERFRTSYVDLGALVAATSEIYEYPMCDRDPLSHWTQNRVSLLGDAAHPMFPMGSNGAGQSIADAVALGRCLQADTDPSTALQSYQDVRLTVTTEIVLRNRTGGPERVIDEVERRAPDGFTRLDEVIDPAELDTIVRSYTAAASSSERPGG